MTKILRFFILVAVLAALWCGVLWLGLPREWIQDLLQAGSLSALIAAHVGPPLFVATAWRLCKWAWNWRVRRAEKRGVTKKLTDQQTAQEAAQTAHEREQARLRAHVECRAAWMVVPEAPVWFEDEPAQCALILQNAEEIQGTGREAALSAPLHQVLELALLKSEASAFLPIMLVTDSPAHREWITQAWHQAVKTSGIEHHPSEPGCAVLPGSGGIPDRVVTLFEENPNLPAVLLVGMDSPLADARSSDGSEDSEAPRPGHALVVLLLSRPGLIAPGDVPQADLVRDADPYTPFWEREQNSKRVVDTPGWGRVPPVLRPAFVQKSPPIATLHRMSAIDSLAPRRNALIKQLNDATHDALVRAGLCALPSEGEAPEAPSGEPKPPELGWLVHNVSPERLGLVTNALLAHGYELEPPKETGHIEEDHGDTGTARGVLMLSEALFRAERLKQPVAVAEVAGNGGGMGIGLVRPVLRKEAA